jgi:hypothetical protein
MAGEKRKEIRKRRKNFFPTLFVIALLWIGLAFEIVFVDPDIFGALPSFFILFFLALLFTLSTLFLDTRRGFMISLAALLFLLLRYFGVGNIVNLILLAGIVIAVEVYFSRN